MATGGVLVLSLCCIYLSVAPAGGSSTPEDYTFSETWGGMYKVHSQPASWEWARLTCEAEGAALATPYTIKAQQALAALMNGTNFPDGIFIGLQEASPIGSYRSVEEYTYNQRTGSCYKFHHDDVQLWTAAVQKCDDDGGHLVIVNSQAEAELMNATLNKYSAQYYKDKSISCYDGMYVGFHGFLGGWRNVDGKTRTASGYDEWKSGKPVTTAAYNCGLMWRGGLFENYACTYTCPFVCEIHPPPIYV